MNGPEVIEQEAGFAELDASDRALVFALTGGEERLRLGLADVLLDDDADAIAAEVRAASMRDVHEVCRSADVERFLPVLTALDPEHLPDPEALRFRRKDEGP
jgi:malonate decarboxylase beta subunit